MEGALRLLLTDVSGCLLARNRSCRETLAELEALGFWPRRLFSEVASAPMPSIWRRWRECRSASAAPSISTRPCIPWHAAPARSTTAMAVRSPSSALVCRVEEATVRIWRSPSAPVAKAGPSAADGAPDAESQHHLSELYALLDGMDDGVLAWDPQGRLRYLNALAAIPAAARSGDLLGQPLEQHLLLPQRLQLAIRGRRRSVMWRTLERLGAPGSSSMPR